MTAPPAQPAALSGYWLIFAAAVLWGLIGLISKGILGEGVSALEIAFWRALLGGAVFLVHAGALGRLRLRSAGDGWPLGGFALVGVSLFFASLILAIDSGGISLAFILLYSAPLFVLIAAWLILGEPLTARKLVLAPLAVLGIALVSGGGGTGVTVSPASLGWGLLAGLTYSSYYVFGKLILRRYRPVTIYAWVLPIGALGLLPFVQFAAKSPLAWLLLAVLAVLSTYLAYLLYYTGLARVEASRAVLVATVEPVVALTLAALLLGERIGPAGLVGAALILLTAVLASTSSGGGRKLPEDSPPLDRLGPP
ncbi:MAG: EamA family transporter [Trueperaceae bacterium]